MAENNQTVQNHRIYIDNRGGLTLTGLVSVGGFDDTEVRLFTEAGDLVIRGKNLEVQKADVDTGELNMTGRIDSLRYGEGRRHAPNNFFAKLVR